MALGIVFLMAAWWVPISRDAARAPAKIETPLAWAQVESALAELRAVATPETVEAVEQKLDALRNQSPESWYSQSSLEAGDALRQETGNAIAALERNLDAASRTLAAQGLQGSGEAGSLTPLDANARDSAAQSGDAKQAQWDQALAGLQSGALALNKADLAALKQFDPKSPLNTQGSRTLSAQQLQALREKLGQQAGACEAALGKVGEALAKNKELSAEKGGQKGAKSDTGAGGTGGGEESAPLGLNASPNTLSPGETQPLSDSEMQHAALGDVLKVVSGSHKVDPTATRPGQAAGKIVSPGAGGEAVWKNELPPAEQTVLRQYFK